MEKKIVVIAGEPSGDLHASLLVSKLKELDKSIKVFAVGGELLSKAGAEIIRGINDLSVLGLFDVLKKIGKFRGLMRMVLSEIGRIKPDAVIMVDFSGFNLRLAKKIKKRYKTIYYISPQVWASRSGRVKTIKEYIDKIFVIFRFEKEFYEKFGVKAEFIGHPLLDIVKPSLTKEEAVRKFRLNGAYPVFALLPGSRVSEIKAILPVMLESAKLIKEKLPGVQFIISKPSSIDSALYRKIVAKTEVEAEIIESMQYDCLNVADFVLVASGTATLEAAIMNRPNIVIYKMGFLTYLLYRPQVKTPFIGMENIVLNKEIAPEFIQGSAKPDSIASRALEIFLDKKKLAEIKEGFLKLKSALGQNDAPRRAAESILTFLNSN